MIAQIHDAFGDVTTFLQNDDLPSTTVTKVSEIRNNPGMCQKFKIELAVPVDAMHLLKQPIIWREMGL